jgi:hypothetical protein
MVLAVVLFVVVHVIRKPIEDERTEHKLSEATLGNVDPTSSTMLVVLGGLRGVASNILWIQAEDLKNKRDWSNLEVVVNSITTLEPHFISVWTFQGWNQAYNVSAEWDQVADKYYWIKKGIRFLQRGTEANMDSPELRWDVGWTYYHKIGRADERELLRVLFRADTAREVDAQGRVQEAFNRDGLDNYMASHGWFEKAVDKCDSLKVKPKRMGEVAFRSYPSHALIDFAIHHEEEGNFGELIQGHWMKARQSLQKYADYDFPFTETRAVHLDYPPEIFSDLYRATSVYTDSKNLNETIGKGLDALSDEQRAELEKDWEKLVAESNRMVTEYNPPTLRFLPSGAQEAFNTIAKLLKTMQPEDAKVLLQSGPAGDAARKTLAEFAVAAEQLGRFADEELYWCDRYATMINFRYWLERTICEYDRETVDAREHFYLAEKASKAAELEPARTHYERGLELWKNVLAKYDRVRDDDLTAEDTAKLVKSFLRVREQLNLPDLAAEDIPFKEFVDRFTPHEPTPEEYQQMMRQMQVIQAQPDQGGDMKKMVLEKLKGAIKDTLNSSETERHGKPPEEKK